MIELKKKYSLQNGNKVTKKNWHKVIAKSYIPCTSNKGWQAIDNSIKETGYYYETWALKKEKEGYIFREINHGGGINGHYETVKEAIFAAIKSYIHVFLDDEITN